MSEDYTTRVKRKKEAVAKSLPTQVERDVVIAYLEAQFPKPEHRDMIKNAEGNMGRACWGSDCRDCGMDCSECVVWTEIQQVLKKLKAPDLNQRA